MVAVASAALAVVLALSTAAVASSIDVAVPLSTQLPLIARVNESYSWTFSPSTFNATSPLSYNVSGTPKWLTFDGSSRTFSGTPGDDDEGSTTVTVHASTNNSRTSDSFDFCVSSEQAPQLRTPISSQFNASNSALSSVFTLAPHSALKTDLPALRIPPRWSFSIGIRGATYSVPPSGDLFYAIRQADGSPLPDWLEFNPSQITLQGRSPAQVMGMTMALAFHASDVEGLSAARQDFALIFLPHEIAQNVTDATVTVYPDTPFSIDVDEALLSTLLVDCDPLNHTTSALNFSVDTQAISWVNFDNNRTISGTPPSAPSANSFSLPVTITGFNETLATSLTLSVGRSPFNESTLPPLLVEPGKHFDWDLQPYVVSNNMANAIIAIFDPRDASNYISFDTSLLRLSGELPSSFPHVTVTFTTAEGARASLLISSSKDPSSPTPGATSSAHGSDSVKKGVAIAVGALLALALFFCILAAVRKYYATNSASSATLPYIAQLSPKENNLFSDEKVIRDEKPYLDGAAAGHLNGGGIRMVPKSRFFNAVRKVSPAVLFARTPVRPSISSPMPLDYSDPFAQPYGRPSTTTSATIVRQRSDGSSQGHAIDVEAEELDGASVRTGSDVTRLSTDRARLVHFGAVTVASSTSERRHSQKAALDEISLGTEVAIDTSPSSSTGGYGIRPVDFKRDGVMATEDLPLVRVVRAPGAFAVRFTTSNGAMILGPVRRVPAFISASFDDDVGGNRNCHLRGTPGEMDVGEWRFYVLDDKERAVARVLVEVVSRLL